MRQTFFSTCVDWPRKHIRHLESMVDRANTITRTTFLCRVDPAELRRLERHLGYDRLGLRMAEDPYVTYGSGILLGTRAYFFVWSAIEHVFTHPETKERLSK